MCLSSLQAALCMFVAQMAAPPLTASNYTVSPAVLFSSLADAHNVVGLLRPRGSTLAAVPGGLQAPGRSNDSLCIYAGILHNATFEIYTIEVEEVAQGAVEAEAEAGAPPRRVIRRYLSTDLKTYSAPTEVFAAATDPNNMTNAAIAKDNSTGAYLLLTFSAIPGDGNGRSKASTYSSTDGGLRWTALIGSGYTTTGADCAHAGLVSHPTFGWLSFQRTLQKLTVSKPYPDSVGAKQRRVVTVLSSKDGKTWEVGAPKQTQQDPSHPAAPPAAAAMLVPGSDDPPELELGVGSFGFVPFWYGKKLAAVATNYIPSPALTNPAQPPIAHAAAAAAVGAASACRSSNATQLADGPIASQEWWVAKETSSDAVAADAAAPGPAADPSAAATWMRPYTMQTQLSGNAGIAGQAAAPLGFMITHAPLMVAQTVMPAPGWPSDGMFWLWRGMWLGLMNWRVGGLYAPGNAVFTTDPFTMPPTESYLWLDLDSRWGATTAARCDKSNFERCQAYVLVELLPGNKRSTADAKDEDAPISGYEKENSNLLHGHYSEQGMPLTWEQPTPSGGKRPPPSVAGELVRARVYLRDATVYAMGAGDAWGADTREETVSKPAVS
eukprot:gene20590-353_t